MPKELNGFPIGIPGEPLAPVIAKLSSRGIAVFPKSISHFRTDSKPGSELEDKIECAKKLEHNDAFNKDVVYLSIARAGVNLRKPQKKPRQSSFTSHRLLEDISSEVGIRRDLVNLAVRAMRAEVLLSNLSEDQREVFDQTVYSYVQGHSVITNRSEVAADIDRNWDGSVLEFYKRICPTRSGLGAWTPYEVAFMRFFYQSRIAQGSPLSPLDRLVLQDYMRWRAEKPAIYQKVTDIPSVLLDSTVLTGHRNYLLRGKPINPRLER